MKSQYRNSGIGGDGVEEVLEKGKVARTMMAMMDGINMVAYLLLNRRMIVLIVTNGELFAECWSAGLMYREFGDGWDKQSSSSSASFGDPTKR